MKLSKRIISAVCAAVMGAGMLTGCGTGKNSGMKEATIWMAVGHSKQFWEKKVEDFNNELSAEYGVKLKLETKTDESYTQAIDVAIQSDQLPDFFSYGTPQKIDEAGVGYPINELSGMDEMIEKYRPYMVEKSHTIGDKVYALPFGMTTRGLIYNKDMFKAAGLVDENGEAKPPRTFDEVREYAKVLTDTSKQEYGIIFPVKWQSWIMSDITSLAQSSTGLNEGYNPETGEYDLSVFASALDLIRGIKEDGSYYPGAESLDNDPARAKFATGKIGMKIGFSFDVGVFNTQFPAEMDWGVAPLPVEDPDNCYKQHAMVGNSMMISKAGVEKLGEETTAAIFKYLYSDDSIRALYKEGLEIPCLYDLVKDVEPDDIKGWKEFSEMTDISIPAGQLMPKDVKGEKSFNDEIINELWTNGKDITSELDEFTQIWNNGVKKYKETHPEIDYSIYIDEQWSEKIRREEY